MCCVTSPSFMLSINGYYHGFFAGKRGLRQGCPLSHYLFTLVMEVFNLILKRRIAEDGKFKYHWRCKEQKITHLCFADDLMIFCYGNLSSVKVIKESLDLFAGAAGLHPNVFKSNIFFGNVKSSVKLSISGILQFNEGKLPMRYLGVPLISTRLFLRDCKNLVVKVKKRIERWENKYLSYAGRLQLISSVLYSMHVYWAASMLIPKSIVKEINSLMIGFLWNCDLSKKVMLKLLGVLFVNRLIVGG